MTRTAWALTAASLMLVPVTGKAQDGSFGVPPSGILVPPLPQPAKTAALIPPERAAPEKPRVIQRVQQTYTPAPADGAGRSRVVPPSEAPVHSPIIVPPKKKQFRAPTATIDPAYVASAGDGRDNPQSAAAQTAAAAAPVVAQGAAPEPKRGLFNMLRNRKAAQPAPVQLAPGYTASAASAAHQEYTAAIPAPAAQPAPSRTAGLFSFGGGKPSARANDGTPCGQLRGIFTSPAECR